MSSNHQEFIKNYTKAVQEGYAAIFAGAGLSRGCGFVSWKELLGGIASSINLDVERESDLVEVAQFYCNENRGRSKLNMQLLNRFAAEASVSVSMDVLTDMPINTFWTTNYDHLLEDTLKSKQKKVDIKVTSESLSLTMEDKDVVVYKMHGDCTDPATCILTKDDYEAYNLYRQLFTTALQGDLVSKTFLFIGFSFDDPNLNYILSRIRVLLGENRRDHYFFLQELSRKNYKTKKEYEYAQNRQTLRIHDLMRYGIQAVMVKSYDEIPNILKRVAMRVRTNNIFISGAANTYGTNWEKTATLFIRDLTRMLYNKNYKIITGHARGVGSYIISTILELVENKTTRLERYLAIRAFPYEDRSNPDYSRLILEYRKGIAKSAGISIFLFGNKYTDKGEILAKGMLEEFSAAKEMGNYIIPVGATGYIAKKICQDVMDNISEYPYLREEIKTLSESTDYRKILASISNILETIESSF